MAAIRQPRSALTLRRGVARYLKWTEAQSPCFASKVAMPFITNPGGGGGREFESSPVLANSQSRRSTTKCAAI